MKAELVEKGDGTLTVRYTAKNAHEATIMAIALMGKDDNVNLSTSSGFGDGSVRIGAANFAVVEMLSPKEAA